MESCKVVIDEKACFLWALLLLVLPLPWVTGFFLAAAVHELFHYMVLRIFRIPVLQLWIGVSGVKMDIPALNSTQELFSALAGPVGGLILLCFQRWYPELAVCALIQSCYNLLPIYPLDGGRVVKCLANMWFCPHAERICRGAEITAIAAIVMGALVLKWHILVLGGVCFLVIKIRSGKIPCKQTYLGVQ